MTNYKDGVIELENAILVITSLENFLKYKPPCDECLIQSMCIKESTDIEPEYLVINVCNKLKTFFITNNKIRIEEDELVKLERLVRIKV